MPKYERFQRDPDPGEAEGSALFDHWAPIDALPEPAATGTASAAPPTRPPGAWNVERVTRLSSLARKIRGRGHLSAQIDPLDGGLPGDPGLDPTARGVTPEDLLELPGQKRFSIEGNDLLIPMLDTVIRGAAIGGIREVVMGMAHRGRLNVLAHVLGKPYAAILAEFHAGAHGPTTAPTEHFTHYGWTGGVKYHLGARKTLTEGETTRVQITLAPNPSHLEFVNPVIEGMARALQDRRERPGMPDQDVRTTDNPQIHRDHRQLRAPHHGAGARAAAQRPLASPTQQPSID